MTLALTLVAVVALACLAITAEFMSRSNRKQLEDERGQHHAQMIDERAAWVTLHREMQEERKMLLDRLSDREGRQVAAIFPPRDEPARPRETVPVPWDDDLGLVTGEEGAEGGPG